LVTGPPAATYLRELLLRLHDDEPRLDEMLSDKWAADRTDAVVI
jgi:hypothetical protein